MNGKLVIKTKEDTWTLLMTFAALSYAMVTSSHEKLTADGSVIIVALISLRPTVTR